MPRGDRTGPMGMGPMTGRRAGYCAGYAMPGYANPGMGRAMAGGFGFGGGGHGWRHMFYATGMPGWMRFGYVEPAPFTPENEAAALKAQAELLQKQLDAITKRIAEIEQK
jgi:hypothetical protein